MGSQSGALVLQDWGPYDERRHRSSVLVGSSQATTTGPQVLPAHHGRQTTCPSREIKLESSLQGATPSPLISGTRTAIQQQWE